MTRDEELMQKIMEQQLEAMMNKMMSGQSSSQAPILNEGSSARGTEQEESSDEPIEESSDDYDDDYPDYSSDDEDVYGSEETQSPASSDNFDNIVVGTTDDDGNHVDYAGKDFKVINGGKHYAEASSNTSKSEFSEPTEPLSYPEDNKEESLQARIIQAQADQIAELRRKLEDLARSALSEKQFYETDSMKKATAEACNKVFNTKQPFENIVSDPCVTNFMGKPFEYQRYEQPSDFGVNLDTSNPEECALNIRKISKCIIRDITNMFGGLDRITDVAVVSDVLIFNSVSYEPVLPDEYVRSLPLDVQNAVLDGRFAWLFDFYELRNMTNLSNLMFDSVDFVFKKVRIDLTARRDFEPKHMFDYCKRLQNMQIGEYIFTRNSMDDYDDIFHKARRSTEMADKFEDITGGWTKSNWSSFKECFTSKEKRGFWRRAGGALGWGTLTAATGAGVVGMKTGRLATRVGKKLINGLSDVIRATKENI